MNKTAFRRIFTHIYLVAGELPVEALYVAWPTGTQSG
jgi:hypothetical protein